MRQDAETMLFDIIDLMRRPGGASVNEICEELGCQRTTFYRYQEKLAAYGIPYYDKDDYNGNTNSKRWYIDDERYKRMLPLRFDHVERMMLRSVLGRTRLFDNTRLADRMTTLKKKLNAAVIHDPKKRVTTTYYSFKGRISYDGKEDIIDALCSCIESGTRATVTYQAVKSPEPKTYEFDPYTLVDHSNALYVIAGVPKHEGNIRIFAVDRIKKLAATNTHYTIPESFDPGLYLNPSFGICVEAPITLKVKFTGDSAFYARERTWGIDQTIAEPGDGSIIISFTACGIEEMVCWVLSFGKGALVLEPESMVRRVKEELEEAARGYQV